MFRPNKVFLDLEDTIITTWHEGLLINASSIREFLEKDEFILNTSVTPVIEEVRIFSFAIWDNKDKEDFVTRHFKDMIERVLGVKVVEWLSVEDMQKIVEDWSGFKFYDRTDFMQLHGKHDAFIKVCLAREVNFNCVLIDDAVPSRTVIDHERNLEINLVPVQRLTGERQMDCIRKL